MKRSYILTGYICRTWTETSADGWASRSVTFKTENEANAYGRDHNRGLQDNELSREYEIIKDYKEVIE